MPRVMFRIEVVRGDADALIMEQRDFAEITEAQYTKLETLLDGWNTANWAATMVLGEIESVIKEQLL